MARLLMAWAAASAILAAVPGAGAHGEVAASAAAVPAVSAASPASSASAPQNAADTPLTSLPYTPVLDTRSMDTRVSPCEDFYRYSCGGWQRDNPIPPDQASWNVYSKMTQDNRRVLWGLLDRFARQPEGRTVAQQKIGDAFAACVDDGLAQSLGARPMAPLIGRIDAMVSKQELPALLARLHLATGDDGLLFGFTSAQDYVASSHVIAFANAGGLGLPDRDYYLKTDAKSVALRAAYAAHVTRMFQLMGDADVDARREAASTMAIETALAAGSLTLVEQRDPRVLVHRVDVHALQAMTPSFAWKPYLAGLGADARGSFAASSGSRFDARSNAVFNVSQPAFLRALDRQLRERSVGELKSYLRWHVAHVSAPFLSSAFVDENFAFFSHTLRGVPQLSQRWVRCVALVDDQLGDALGQEFVKLTFGPELKAKTLHMTMQIEAAMDGEIRRLDWMSAPTKVQALEKLHDIVNKIGYPDQWRDYSALEIRRDDLLGNVQRGNEFEMRRLLAKIGKPLARSEWGMTPPTVNAYYDPQLNDINFPAGVLQPPLFDAKLDDAPNYGNTGGTIGHELTHGFDDEGRQFDARGNVRNWWTKKDAAAFEQRTQCLVDEYGGFVAVDDVHVNSKLTLGEDLADFGGLVLAMIAWKAESAAHPPPPLIDGFTPDQRFFIGMAQWACENVRPEQQRLLAATDPHSPDRYRVNGLVANFAEFETAFACKPGQPMAPLHRCRVW